MDHQPCYLNWAKTYTTLPHTAALDPLRHEPPCVQPQNKCKFNRSTIDLFYVTTTIVSTGLKSFFPDNDQFNGSEIFLRVPTMKTSTGLKSTLWSRQRSSQRVRTRPVLPIINISNTGPKSILTRYFPCQRSNSYCCTINTCLLYTSPSPRD